MVEEPAPRPKLSRTGDDASALAARGRRNRLALKKSVPENEKNQGPKSLLLQVRKTASFTSIPSIRNRRKEKILATKFAGGNIKIGIWRFY